MTILTKSLNDKKTEKLPLPLALGDVAVLNGVAQRQLLTPTNDDYESMLYERPAPLTWRKTCFLFALSLLVMSMGLVGGYTLYQMWVPSRALHYHALCSVPLKNTSAKPRFFTEQSDLDAFMPLFNDAAMRLHSDDLMNDDYFREDIELNVDGEDNYAKISVPDFKEGRQGKFMHDFKENQSAIIDISSRRCFVMPLDRETTLPPHSLMDLMEKTSNGYYNIDTERVRHRMRVVLPAITDLSLISKRIANECLDKHVYMLEKSTDRVFKRAAEEDNREKFAAFFGNKIVEYDIKNLADIEQFERNEQN